jgi:hypothetical protein
MSAHDSGRKLRIVRGVLRGENEVMRSGPVVISVALPLPVNGLAAGINAKGLAQM